MYCRVDNFGACSMHKARGMQTRSSRTSALVATAKAEKESQCVQGERYYVPGGNSDKFVMSRRHRRLDPFGHPWCPSSVDGESF
eukprot:353839-Chlamydomonas_euryale.AAC.31